MKERIIQYLACPDCSSDLELISHSQVEPHGHILSGDLICRECNNSFPIINGVPFFKKELIDTEVDKNRNNFADEWNYFTANMDIKNEALAKGELDSYFNPFVNYSDLENKIVLDGGCGGGRLIYIVSKHSKAKEIFGIDLSNAVFTAFKHTKDKDNVTIIQADIYKPPFKKNTFDFIYSVGVLHHLPNPKGGFSSLVRFLKPDGDILSWVYGKEGNFLYIKFADPIRQFITSRLPFKINLYLSWLITLVVWLIIFILYVPANFILKEKTASKILPFNKYFMFFRERGFADFWRTIFDKMVPTISYYISEGEFKDWFTTNNLNYKTFFRNGHSWLGIGKKEPMPIHHSKKQNNKVISL